MRALVTGVAGFIGGHLARTLLDEGHEVVGIDALTDYYDPEIKRRNLSLLAGEERFSLQLDDLVTAELRPLVHGVDTVFHLAGQPGVRGSWRTGFEPYVVRNVLATQRLLEACTAEEVGRVVYASSSSVYGNARSFPTTESDLPRPFSPYGVTKLAAEHLCTLYADNFGLHVTSVRYFTVYGPRQRPDMATSRLIDAAIHGTPFPLFGDGSQRRDFTFVLDAVDATRRAGSEDVPPGSVFNVGGGSDTSMSELIDLVASAVGKPVVIDRRPTEPGDAVRTGADTTRARELLGWRPRTSIAEGVARQVASVVRDD